MSPIRHLGVCGALCVCAGSAHAQGPTFTAPACVSNGAQDQDGDGISDLCEFQLAQAVAPVLVIRTGGCSRQQGTTPERLGGGYLFAVQRVDSVFRVAFLPAYFRDCGWSGVKCLVPWVSCEGHNGDSEFIVVDVRHESADSQWRPQRMFLSAHCFGRTTKSCRWYEARDLSEFEWSGSSPVVWVSEGRNANYMSQEACDQGHRSLDTCDNHDGRYQFPVHEDHNIGSRDAPSHPDGCISGAFLKEPRAEPDAVECFWDADGRFRGWQREGRGVTGYSRYLSEIARF